MLLWDRTALKDDGTLDIIVSQLFENALSQSVSRVSGRVSTSILGRI